MTLFVYFLAWYATVYGVAMIVTTFKLFKGMRDRFPKAGDGELVTPRNAFGTLLSCTPCFATWVAWGFGVIGFSPFLALGLPLRAWVPGIAQDLFWVAASGLAAAALTWLARVVLVRLGSDKL